MSYKTILVHVDESHHSDMRIDIAATIAAAENAHLVGAAMTGISRFLYETVAFNPDDPGIEPYLDTLRQRATDTLEKFDKTAQRIGNLSYEKRLVDDEAAAGLSLHARYCDLVVLGQNDPDAPSAAVGTDFPEGVVINAGCPVLIIPYAGTFKSVGSRVLVAWNGSVEARRAVHDAIPLLRRADIVEVVVFNPAEQPEVYGRQPGVDIAIYLARHGIKVDVKEESTDNDIGDALLSLTTNLGSDLLVMGGYGHSRFREILLGGVTRTILESMTVPVLMSH